MLNPTRPLVLTLSIDKPSQTFLTDLRAKYFPSHRNFLSAHITLFHAIPPHRFAELDHEITSIAQSTPEWDIFIDNPTKMGKRGVMVTVRERPRTIENIHHQLLELLKQVREDKDRCTEQDLRPMGKPHVTILNKAEEEEEVEKCLKEVKQVFEELKGPGQKSGQKKGNAIGIQLWEYMGGPWRPLKEYSFTGETQPK